MRDTSKATPGPWTVSGDAEVYYAPDGFAVASAQGYKGEREANARLISAAPDMLEALKRAAEALQTAAGCPDDTYWEPGGEGHDANNAALEAIAKAVQS